MKFKISTWQIFWLWFSFEIGMALLLTLSPTIQAAKQDAWICALLALVFTGVLAWIAVKLGQLYPTKTVVEASQTILGKALGRIIMVPFLIMWYSVTGIVLRQFTDFAHMALFNRTPIWALVLPFIALAAYAAYTGGIEGIARCAEIVGPIVVIVICVIVILNIPNMKPSRLLPLYGDVTVWGMFKGTMIFLSFFGEVVSLITMVIPFSKTPDKMWSVILKGILVMGIAVIVSVLSTLLMFGPNLGEKMIYPAYETVRYVSAMEFIQNIDSIVVIVWFFTYFVKVAFYFFITSIATTQWFGIKNTKPANWVVLLIVCIISLTPSYHFANFAYPQYWARYVLPINFICIPTLLWIVGVLRIRRQRKRHS